jgi:transcriptional regulator of acetoin/glycerol metabolism
VVKVETETVSFASTETADNLTLSDLEKEAITNAISQASGNISQAAKLLGLSRAALYRKLEKYGI